MDEFTFKTLDAVGLDTLSVIEEAKNFNSWTYNTIRPWLKGKVLEIGSGTGNISEFAVAENLEIVLSDIRENYRTILTNKFGSSSNVKAVLNLDIVSENFQQHFREYLGSFDSLFCLNVVEHIKDDALALQNCALLLKPGGNMVILVPAFQGLYNEFDRQLEHYRRYNRRSLEKIFPSGFSFAYSRYFNVFGILGWFVSGKLMNKSLIPGKQMKIFDFLIRFLKYADNLVFRRAGLSVIVVGKKPA
jgi:SAM-dependent methyltransferase